MKNIILIHGLYMKSFYFNSIKKELAKKNVNIKTLNYNTRLVDDKTITRLSNLVESINNNDDIFIIGHSLGGLLARKYLTQYKPNKKIVLITLGTPHNTSEVAKRLEKTLFKYALGKSLSFGLSEEIEKWNGDYPLISISGIKKIGKC